MKRRITSMLLAAAMTITMLTGCGSQGKETEKTDTGAIVLDMYHSWSTDSERGAALDKLIQEFNKEYEGKIEVKVTINVTSNKNSNKYILKQTYQSPNKSMQEVIEPSNIAGVKLENDGTNLKIENSQLNLSTILENYNYLGDNCLDLYSFIENYKQDSKSKFEEKDSEIIMKTNGRIDNVYMQEKILHVDKQTYNPTQMEIKDNKQKTTIYILYNEVKVNSSK